MIKKVIVAAFLLLIGGLGGYLIFKIQAPADFGTLEPGVKLQRIIREQEQAIQEAVKEGVYKCCIEPACTMCYMEANKWNNYQAGTCACDDLIAQGEEPCPQCQKGLCLGDVCKTQRP